MRLTCTAFLQILIIAGALRAQPQEAVRVLFLGNSYTHRNDLPKTFEKLAMQSGGVRVEVDSVTAPGATLQNLYEQTNAREKLRRQKWTYVVLQDHSALGSALVNGEMVINDPLAFHTWARIWDREIKDAGAKTVFFHTWARKGKRDDQRLLDYAYMAITKELNAIVVPVGVVWQRILLSDEAAPLYAADGSHPSSAGTHLAACAFSAMLLDRKCPDTVEGIRPALAAKIGAVSTEAAEQLRRAGGYLMIPRPVFTSVIAPHASSKPKPANLAGTWLGQIKFHNSPATVTLKLAADEQGCRAEWTVTATDFQSVSQGGACSYIDNGVRFVVSHPAGTSDVNFGVLVDANTLTGIARQFSYSTYSRREGTWTLKRQ